MTKCRMKNCNNDVVPDHQECGKCMDLMQETMEAKADAKLNEMEDD